MTDEEIKKAREKYNNLVSENKELERIKCRLSELRDNPLVQEYISLSYVANQRVYLTDERVIENAFNDIAVSTIDYNDIYVYVGSYSYDSFFCQNGSPVSRKTHSLYKNLETKESVEVRISKQAEFESKHTVIYLKPTDKLTFDEAFNKIRNEFFGTMLKDSQEEAVKVIVMKYNSKE